MADPVRLFADELRKWWSFDNGQVHTHSWHSREDFIEKKLPDLLATVARAVAAPEIDHLREKLAQADDVINFHNWKERAISSLTKPEK